MTFSQATIPEVLPRRRTPLPLDRAFPGVRFSTILIDPPVRYANYTDSRNGAAASQYETLSQEDLLKLPVASVAAKDCACLLWVGGPKLNEGVALLPAWGFRFVTVAFVWNKVNADGTQYMGLGNYTRSGSEFCLLGIRGSVPVPEDVHDVYQVIYWPVGPHSAKPYEQYDRIERLWPRGPYLELFARGRRRGWSQWGDETGPYPEGHE